MCVRAPFVRLAVSVLGVVVLARPTAAMGMAGVYEIISHPCCLPASVSVCVCVCVCVSVCVCVCVVVVN